MAFTIDPDETLEEMRALTRVVADASSLIYARKSGVLDLLSRSLNVSTIPGVVREVGFPVPGITVLNPEHPEIRVDDQIVMVAQTIPSPVLSEDRAVIMKVDEAGLGAYNMLVMLELMLLRGHLDLTSWDRAYKRLLAAAHYGPRVVHAGQMLHWAVRKETG